MRIGEVIGRIVLCRCDGPLNAGRFMILRPQSLAALQGDAQADGEPVVAYDELGAHTGMLVAFSEGREAAMPWYPQPVGVDAYIGCLLDEIVVEATQPAAART
jgi:microcompartment protein CcmK/EutM